MAHAEPEPPLGEPWRTALGTLDRELVATRAADSTRRAYGADLDRLAHWAEATPDTVLTLCDGNKLVIGESVEEVVTRVRHYRASILSLADQVAVPAPPAPALHVVVPLHGREA